MNDPEDVGLPATELPMHAAPEEPDLEDFEPARQRATSEPSRSRGTREYYSIGEVCELVDLKPHVLRYWEAQFPPLNPAKNRSGNRVYRQKEIRLILLVKHLLYHEKYTIDGAKRKLEQLRRDGELAAGTRQAVDANVIQLLREELQQLFDEFSTDESD